MFKAVYWRYALVAVSLAGVSIASQADSLTSQRERYQQVKDAWDANQMDTVAQLMPTLRDYPLYPYLEYRSLTQDLTQLTSIQAKQFIASHPTLPLTHNLETSFINELARREDWRGLLAFSPSMPKPMAARCNYLYAKWVTGQRQGLWEQNRDIWLNGRSLPASCDNLLTSWQQSGILTPSVVLERILLAMDAGSSNLVAHLVRQLPSDYQTIADALSALQRDPMTLEHFARTVGPTDFSRKVTLTAFTRVARQDPDEARSMLPIIVRLQGMSSSERSKMEEDVVWRLMGKEISGEQAEWRDAVIQRSQSTALLERRVRMALGEGDQRGLAVWLARLPAETLQKDEWRYWRARLAIENGQRAEGEAQLRELMKARGFYPMIAAQQLKTQYPLTIKVAAKPDRAVEQLAEVARIRELMYWHMDNLARSEWSGLVASRERLQQQALARFSFEQGWYDLSVQATIIAKMWDNLEERFPLAWNEEFRRATQGKDISQSYAMAIARQESAWNSQAKSAVGASGLMQLMPATALHTAKKFDVASYSNSTQLMDPQTNIDLGTLYLEYVYQSFGQNRILASAAYNAGPSRVNAWLRNSNGRIDAVAFVESIPFSETRNYVKNVLAYDAYYRYFLKHNSPVLMDSEMQRRY